ncbi:MAG: prepilin-type N-terminal cleavage/methylation domain-containing protein [Nitrospirae bacterium]|nr:prepilin-type N-terminal cleavage/methylation domain-containing protein [Nitrospirota bacterium]
MFYGAVEKLNKKRKKPTAVKLQPSTFGFTLVEVILSIVILCLVALIIGSGFRLGIDAWERGDKETSEIQKYRVLYELMSQQIKSAYPYKMKIDEKKVVIFKGESDSIMFVTVSHDSNFRGFKWIRYRYKDGALLYKEGVLPDKKLFETTFGDDEIVESKIGEVKFSYLASDGGEFKESWDMGDSLPGAVTLKIGDFEPMIVTLPLVKIDPEGKKNNGAL